MGQDNPHNQTGCEPVVRGRNMYVDRNPTRGSAAVLVVLHVNSFTDAELALITGMKPKTEQAYRVELCRRGFAGVIGMRKEKRQRARVWGITEAGRRHLKTVDLQLTEAQQTRVKIVLAQIESTREVEEKFSTPPPPPPERELEYRNMLLAVADILDRIPDEHVCKTVAVNIRNRLRD